MPLAEDHAADAHCKQYSLYVFFGVAPLPHTSFARSHAPCLQELDQRVRVSRDFLYAGQAVFTATGAARTWVIVWSDMLGKGFGICSLNYGVLPTALCLDKFAE
jgi:hypothetical protein